MRLPDIRGVTLRDVFALAALEGMLTGNDNEDKLTAWENPDMAAAWAYEFADAMLKERAK